MSYRFDDYDSSLVIEGWEKGISDSPHTGISDMRNVNIISIPGEASVNFATSKTTSPAIGATVVTSLSSNTITFSGGAIGLENGMAISFSSVGGLTGISTNTTYWVFNCAGSPTTSCKLSTTYTDIGGSPSAVAIGGAATGTPTFAAYTVGFSNPQSAFQAPKYFAYAQGADAYFMQDGIGQVWSNSKTTPSGYWTFTGVSGTGDTNSGCGLVYYKSTASQIEYIFAFNNKSIDYLAVATFTWAWGWRPDNGSVHNAGNYLKSASFHEAMLMPTNQVIYCDGQYVGRFYEKNPATDFDPTNTATYVYDTTQLLPGTDNAQCLAYLGTSILIGGKNNIIYPWNGTATTFSYPILLAEFDVKKMVTLNTNTYIFVGNRGRIYVTNGTNASLFKKVPDHISGTVEPYFIWGGACTHKNQLYFSILCTTNAGTAINQYGGLWAIDMDTNAMRLSNQLSYATYAGYAPAMTPVFVKNNSTPSGTGLFIGWDDNAFHYGIDKTSSTPYTGSQAIIDSDLVPIGTFTDPRDFTTVEYKLVRPLVGGESIVVQTRLIFNTQDTGYTTTLTDSTAGNFSNRSDINFKNAQWVQFKIILNSTASTPSYVRLKHIRILGLTGPTLAQSQQLSL